MRETIGPARVFEIVKTTFRIEIANFAGDLTIVTRCVKSRDLANSAFALGQILPKTDEIVAYRRDDAETGDDNSAIAIH